jgi:hypothetical protein
MLPFWFIHGNFAFIAKTKRSELFKIIELTVATPFRLNSPDEKSHPKRLARLSFGLAEQ